MASVARMGALFALVVLLIGASPTSHGVQGLTVGYYKATCPTAESLIQKAVAAPSSRTSKLRLAYCDCTSTTASSMYTYAFGCDGSNLIDSTAGNQAEKDGRGNVNSLRGFEAIDAAKAQVEAACPGVVSCADILAYAARDSVVLAGGTSWAVEGGRLDGRRSSSQDLPGNLPPPTSTVAQNTALFAAKGLSQDEMVTLSGGHSIGQAHCAVFASRINASNPDPTLDATYAKQLAAAGPAPTTTLVNMEPTPTRMDSRYYSELLENRGLFTSDQVLASDAATRPAVVANANGQTNFLKKFANAMVHMGQIPIPSDSNIHTEIRRNCRVFNSQ